MKDHILRVNLFSMVTIFVIIICARSLIAEQGAGHAKGDKSILEEISERAEKIYEKEKHFG